MAMRYSTEQGGELGLAESFSYICLFISDYPDAMTKRVQALFKASDGIEKLAKRYIRAYRKVNIPSQPSTVPDSMVDVVMQEIFGYTEGQCEEIKITHQQAMSAENCVGALLERYLDSVLRQYGWHWCCGSIVRAVDFVYRKNDGDWAALQIKNRDNSENSSSSAIREGTDIQKWFRTFSRTGKTNWGKLPPAMCGHGLSEEGFVCFARNYLRENR